MKKLFVLFFVVLAFGGCQDELVPDDIKPASNTGGGGDSEDPRGGKILDQGLALYNMPGGIFDEMAEGEYDTAETIGRTLSAGFAADDALIGTATPAGETYVADDNEDTRAKYIVKGPAISSSKLDSGGFTDVMFIYYKEPLMGEFTIRARVLITQKAGDSSSKGFFFGGFTPEPNLVGGNVDGYMDKDGKYKVPGNTSMGAGILYRTNDTADNNSGGPSMRPYFKEYVQAEGGPPGGWSTGPSQSSAESGNRLENWMNFRQPGWKQERIVEVSRVDSIPRTGNDGKSHNTVFRFKVYDSKSFDQLQEVYVYDNSINANLKCGNPIYAGIALLGISVEFSQITVWDSADTTQQPIFTTPETHPAYVAVESIKEIKVNLVNSVAYESVEKHPTLPATLRTTIEYRVAVLTNTALTLTPIFSPSYADNEYFDWKLVIPEPASLESSLLDNGNTLDTMDGITIEKMDGNAGLGWKKARVKISDVGTGSYVIMATSRDSGLADYCLEIRVR